jgi:formate-dependent nitrite reductase membrane component NrfD
MFKEGQVHLRPLGSPEPDPAHPGDPRVDYDVPHRKAWGIDLVLYLLTKGISTGAMFLSALLWAFGDRSTLTGFAGPLISAMFSALTAVVLIIDLERPERFFYILQRPNWNSWMTRGAFLLTGHGIITTLWLGAWLLGWTTIVSSLVPFALVAAFGTTVYTGFLFAQGLARDLWQGPHSAIDLMAQATAEGAAILLLAALAVDHQSATIRELSWTLALASVVHLMILVFEHLLAPSPTLHHELAVRAIREGAYKRLFWIGALGLGGIAPIVLVVLSALMGFPLAALGLTALVALAGGLAWEYVWVDAGQSVPLS